MFKEEQLVVDMGQSFTLLGDTSLLPLTGTWDEVPLFDDPLY